MRLILEYAQAIAQLKAGNIYAYSTGTSRVRQEDILPIKSEAPDLKIYANDPRVSPAPRSTSAGCRPGSLLP